ncbi:MAG TPA: molybdopterin-synthase adenylyltransferase MoeB [Opitutaceae bacterium]|nr:molybdopterin-synthase adenylyltransferase MoeB [Opitutaceae bacterium]
MNFTPDEIARYQRHLSLAGFGPAAQEKLKRGSVLVIGAGGLGCPALLYLAAAGVGRIEIVDDDVVDVSNLQRQVLYTEADAGRLKVEAAADRLRGLNRFIEIAPHAVRLTRDNALELVRRVDVVVDGSDNFGTRYLVNDACVLGGRPLVYGAIQGFEGQASVFNWRGGPTYRCIFPEPPEPGTVPNCAEAGVIGALPGLIGTVQALEAIKLLTGIGESLSGKLMLWDALGMTTQVVRIAADPRSRQITELPPAGYGETCTVGTEPHAANAGPLEAAFPEEIDVEEFVASAERDQSIQVVDVRETWERMLGAIEPSVLVPLSDLEHGQPDLSELDPAKPTVVYCAAGIRSIRGADLLRDRHGFRNVTSLRGGIKAWARRR